MTPKANYFDALVDKKLNTNIRDTAKELGIGEKAFVSFLIEKDMFSDRGNIENCVHMPNTQRAETACLS